MKIDLRPTKIKLMYSLLISLPISLITLVLVNISKKISAEIMSPEEFHIIYIAPILIFLATYFSVCWYITRKHHEDVEWPVKNVK